MLTPKLLLLGCLALSTITVGTGCSAGYWREFFYGSQVKAIEVTPAKLDWKGTEDTAAGGGAINWEATVTPPVVIVKLSERSAPVELKGIAVQYLDPSSGEPLANSRGHTGSGNPAAPGGQITDTFMNYFVTLSPPKITTDATGKDTVTDVPNELKLNEVVSAGVLRATEPPSDISQGAAGEFGGPVINADLTFRGETKLGQTVTWKATVPIHIYVKAPGSS